MARWSSFPTNVGQDGHLISDVREEMVRRLKVTQRKGDKNVSANNIHIVSLGHSSKEPIQQKRDVKVPHRRKQSLDRQGEGKEGSGICDHETAAKPKSKDTRKETQ